MGNRFSSSEKGARQVNLLLQRRLDRRATGKLDMGQVKEGDSPPQYLLQSHIFARAPA